MALDISLSCKESYAEQTWEKLAKPYARVKGVQGIFNAHKRCAELVYTSFYVVDADADLEDDFDFIPTRQMG